MSQDTDRPKVFFESTQSGEKLGLSSIKKNKKNYGGTHKIMSSVLINSAHEPFAST